MSEPPHSPLLIGRAGDPADRQALRRLATRISREVAGGRRFTCLLTDDTELRRLNRQFLGRDYPTDVLSFPSAGGNNIGEIAISMERARAQALEHGHTTRDEAGLLMLHGVLHLVGLDHERDNGRMRRAEARWRTELGLPRGLIERGGRRR